MVKAGSVVVVGAGATGERLGSEVVVVPVVVVVVEAAVVEVVGAVVLVGPVVDEVECAGGCARGRALPRAPLVASSVPATTMATRPKAQRVGWRRRTTIHRYLRAAD
ncbi:MAG: hypothetical protein KGJ77_01345 [Acidobacteriota bacterium]|nr:hypothetical protein [Acidobacteriota bacterium]